MDDVTVYLTQIKQLQNKISDLEEELHQFKDLINSLSETKRTMLSIIAREVSDLNTLSEDRSWDRDEVKKFDTLVKNYDLLTKDIAKVMEEKEEEMSDIAELVELALCSVDDE